MTKAAGRDNLVGSLFMILSMAGFAVEDALLKRGADVLPIGEAVVFAGLTGMVIFAVLARLSGQSLLHPAYIAPAMRVRAAFEITGRLAYTLSFVLIPIITATAILQATPLVVVAGAALFLGEKVGWRRWSAILIGLIGVLIILRPWGATFDIYALLAVVGMLGFAGRDLATRASPPVLKNFQLGINGYAMLTIAGAIIWAFDPRFVALDLRLVGILLTATLAGALGYYSLTVAMRTGDVSTVTPWRYSRLIFGAILGVIMFSDKIDTLTLIGSLIVVGSGVFTLLRTNRPRT